MIDMKRTLRRLIFERNISNKDIAKLMGVSDSNFSMKLSKKDFTLHGDIETIADVLGYDVKIVFIDKETGKEIECE